MKRTTSRRAVLAGAAALPALAMPTIATATGDPIFAAIERYEQSHQAFISRCDYEDARGRAGQPCEPAADDHRTPEMIAIVDESIEARMALANAAPTTLGGLVAYLKYVLSRSEDELLFDGDDEIQDFVKSLLRAAQ